MEVDEKYGRLTVIELLPSSKVRCLCECGKEKKFFRQNVQRGMSRSCGCLKAEQARTPKTHGMCNHRLYGVWEKVKDRCRNPNNRAYRFYGGRGIVVCERWLAFENFVADMATAWREGLTIERIDNDGPYSPNNCRWATRTEQAANRSNAKLIDTPWGRITIGAAAKNVGLGYVPMMYRVHNWPADRWFEPPRR